MRKQKMMTTALVAVLALALAFAVQDADAVASSGGSGTQDDPYVFLLTVGDQCSIAIPAVGTFTSYRAVGGPATIDGMTFETALGTADTLDASDGLSGGQSPHSIMHMSGTPTTPGTWDLKAENPVNAEYYRIVVSGAASDQSWMIGTAQDAGQTTFTVTYDGNGGDPAKGTDSAVKGAKVTLPDVSRDGYKLIGWFDGIKKAGAPGDEYTVNGDVTLKAEWVSENPSDWIWIISLAIAAILMLAVGFTRNPWLLVPAAMFGALAALFYMGVV